MNNDEKKGGKEKPSRKLDRDELGAAKKKLSDELRSMYNSVLEEPLPDNMIQLLEGMDLHDDLPTDRINRSDSE